MAGVTAQGGTFTFLGVVASISSISVETPVAGIVDMTGTSVTSAGQVILVPTGGWSGGSVSVDYIRNAGGGDPAVLVRKVGPLTFQSGQYAVTRQAVLESATTSASVGEIVRGTLKFRLTDYAVSDSQLSGYL